MGRPRKSEKTRILLLNKGLELLTEFGYHGTGIKEILDAVDVPKGSFYNYFKSKEHFCAEIVNHYTKLLSGMFDAYFESRNPDEPIPVSLKNCFTTLIKSYESQGYKSGCPIGNLVAEIGDTSDTCNQAFANAARQWNLRISGALEEGQRQGTIRKDMDPTVMAELLWSAWEGSLLTMKIEKSIKPLESCLELLIDNFFAPKTS